MASQAFILVWGLALSCWSKISVGFLWNWTCLKCFLYSVNVLMYASQLTVSPISTAFTRTTPSQSQRRVMVTLPTDGNFLNFLLPGRLKLVPFQGLLFFPLWFKMMDPSFISCKNLGEEGLSLSVKTYQQLRRNDFSPTFVFKYKAPRNPSYVYLRKSRPWMMWLMLPLLTKKLCAGCWVVMCQSSWTMASAFCSISGLTAMTEWSEQGKLCSSTLPVSEVITTLFAQWPNSTSVDCSTATSTRKDAGERFSLMI